MKPRKACNNGYSGHIAMQELTAQKDQDLPVVK